MEHIVDFLESGGRISKRIAEQTVDVPVASGRATSSAAVATSATAESPSQDFPGTFPRGKKCDSKEAVDCEHAVALSGVHGGSL